ncbi:MAG: deoxyguanosinetriphosphate triphosphohydrolase [Deltaproteobacteria bacterium]|nr:deoxyguanosinetriphosphate triphosphohydrolase [Deltaproteobacteria bacterium]
MLTRTAFEKLEEKNLAPYAQLSSTSRGRQHPEEECEFRSRFQRDCDRIVHSTAFRRLEYKTQVFVNHEGDYYRTRLTHSLEVSQIARGLARMLRLNEDLAQTIALAHDLGHTPFGHAGEAAMNELMKDHGGFEHNRQSHRVVTELEERYPNFKGLNLSFEVLEGILKHTKQKEAPTLEAQLVNFADEIAYMNHDLDDGLQYGLLTLEQLEAVPLWAEIYEEIKIKNKTAAPKVIRYRTISRLIHTLITGLQAHTELKIQERKIESLEDVRKNGDNLVGFDLEMRKKAKELKMFLYKNMYGHPRVVEKAFQSKKIVFDLFNAYLTKKSLQDQREICDYIAGMTDRFALQEHKKLSAKESPV